MRNQKPDHVSLNTLVNHLRDGRFVIPDFQRDFEWRAADINHLMKSIFLDYYVGSLLLWKGKAETIGALACEGIYGYSGDGKPEFIVLDGQQRLTAMHYCFFAPKKPLPGRANRYLYFVRIDLFMDNEYEEAFTYEWLKGRVEKLENKPAQQFAEHLFPLSVIGKGGWDLFGWVLNYQKYWGEKAAAAADEEQARIALRHVENGRQFGEALKALLDEYQISYIELDRDIETEKVCDIFTQINSRGVQLDTFDLMNALLKPKGLQLKQMWRDAELRLARLPSERMNVYLLQVMSILAQAYCSPKYLYFLLPGEVKPVRDPDGTRRTELLIPDIAAFEARWNDAVGAMEETLRLLFHPQEFGVTAWNYIPYVSILPAFAALLAKSKTLDSSLKLEANRKLRHWYWASIFLSRYSQSVESTAARDFGEIAAWMQDASAEPGLIRDFRTQFRSIDFRKETKRGTSIYSGIFNLLVIHGAKDWMTGMIPPYGDLDDHHIVPKSWGAKNGKAGLIDSILNRTPLTAETNRNVIGDRLPNDYLPELFARSSEAAVRGLLESHFISPAALAILLRNPFTPDDFEAFVQERQRTLQEAIEDLLIKERLNLEPSLRELDARVEKVELNLRKFIADKLNDDPILLPQHVQQKLEERIRAAAKKNAALELDLFKQLGPRMEFADLRELQDVIGAKERWTEFQPIFVNKETLTQKFDKLADLRNAIRHSRTADAITRKEGEAALIWFETVMKAPRVGMPGALG
jgi:hypothetical protein